jgi:hypothetical protein
MVRISIGGTVAEFSMNAQTPWQVTRQLRVAVLEGLAEHTAELRDATALVATELVENVVKYGLGGEGQEPLVHVDVQADLVRVRTLNRADDSQARSVLATLTRIAGHADRDALYADVIEHGLQHARPGVSQQGFYRIAAVSGFSLHGALRDGQLEIIAERRFT